MAFAHQFVRKFGISVASMTRAGGFLWVVLTCGACSRSPVARLPEVSVPLEITPTPAEPLEPEPEAEPPERLPLDRSSPGHGPQGRAPDPPALRSSVQYELDLRYERGRIDVARAELLQLPRPMVTPRRMGRFAIELWVGVELVERVRFDFPLLAAQDPTDVSLERGLVTSQKVLVPATHRPARALLVDRATNQEIELTWPPVEPEGLEEPEPAPDAGSAEESSE